MNYYEVRALDPVTDEPLFKEAYEWILAAPDWFQYLEGVVATINGCYSWHDYLKAAAAPTEYNIGLFNGKLRAVYTIQDQKDRSFQVHIGAEKGVDETALVNGAIQLKDWLFEHGAVEVFGYLASVNRPMRRFAERAGFSYCGLSVFKGSLNDKPVRWLRYSAAH